MLTTDTQFRGRMLKMSEARELFEKLTGVLPHAATVHRWTKAGIFGKVLPSHRVGYRLYVYEGDVQDYVRVLTQQENPLDLVGETDEGASV